MYNEFYGFSKNPFDVAPDPEFLYLTSSHRKALDAMMKGIETRQGFISIIGEVGTGKTTLIHTLLKSLNKSVKTAFIYNTFITFEELLESILHEICLDISGKDKKALQSQLVEYLSNLGDDETMAVIIDEAQHLATETLQELGKLPNLEPLASGRLQIVFVGQPEFEDILNTPSLKSLKTNIVIKREIKPLTVEESIDYIEHRLKLVSSCTLDVFTFQAVSAITTYAKGIPRLINIVCDNALLSGFTKSKKKIDAKLVHEVIKNLEGPSHRQFKSASIFRLPKRSHQIQRERILTPWHIAVILLLMLSVGGIVFAAYGFLQHWPFDRQNIVSIWTSLFHTERPLVPASQTATKKTSIVSEQHPPMETRTRLFQSSPSALPQAVTAQRISEIVRATDDVIVKKGQSITLLAEKHYGMSNMTIADLILDSNPEITDANIITVNQRIRMPKISEGCLIVSSSMQTYKINVGTFSSPNFAKLYRDEPSLRGKKVEVIAKKATRKDTWYRIVVGKYNSTSEVLKEISVLKEKNLLPLFGANPKPK
ncbi:MAG: AAA family ATPase [Syntrophaceae bacterium]|nr:AAA family ATPase [Syntrophaceae bacterium]